MQNPTDASLDVARATLQNSLRVMAFWEETQHQVLQLHVKALEDAIAGANATAAKVSEARDWAAFSALPAALLRDQSVRHASVLQDTIQLISAAQANMVSHMREASETLQSAQTNPFGQLPSPQVPVPTTLQAWMETVGAMNPLAAQWMEAARNGAEAVKESTFVGNGKRKPARGG